MLFHSYIFIFLFLPAVLGGYALMARHGTRATLTFLVAASLLFYGWWNPPFVILIALSVCVNYTMGRNIHESRSRPLLIAGIVFNLGLIAYYKYAGFFAATFLALSGDRPFQLESVFIPLGISFYTFQQIAYLVDSYRHKVVRHDFVGYALFVTFFPQLIAGPIVHQSEILPQFTHRKIGLRQRDLAIGLTIFALGLFKKVVIAESMADYASPVFNAAAQGEVITFLEAWAGSLAYTFQLYFDFSGYSDMAIGIARMFSIRLPLNFNSPYKATSIIDFWRRWHMTLSRFLRDYLYFPLGGSRKGSFRRYANLIIVMLLGGLWHGAGWTFVFWGGLHGFFLVINHGWLKISSILPRYLILPVPVAVTLSWSVTFLSVVIAWVFFRASTFDAALNILAGMAALDGRLVVTVGYAPLLEYFGLSETIYSVTSQPLLYFAGREEIAWLAVTLGIVLVLPNTQIWTRHFRPVIDHVELSAAWPRALTWTPSTAWSMFVLVLAAVAIVSALQPTEFLYWQF